MAGKKVFDGVITSLGDAIQRLEELEADRAFCQIPKRPGPPDKFPFGIWFRGQADSSWPLKPKVFRQHKIPGSRARRCYDETNLYTHSRARLPDYHSRYQERFSWLCLMQHYDVATRLLDWSESPLIALYFAVRGASKEKRKKSAALVVLNARRLNYAATGLYTLRNPESPFVRVLSELSYCRNRTQFDRFLSPFSGQRDDLKGFKTDHPIAVYPNRLNERMVFQSSVFTLHGGKIYRTDDATAKKDRIAEPVHLEEINGKAKVLKYFEVPGGKPAATIERDLFKLGIHEGSLFPEIDKQAVYLQSIW